jgi:hypothetical protein
MNLRILMSALAAGGLLLAAAPIGLAQTGGLPDTFVPLARDFGLEVSETARTTPDAVAETVSSSTAPSQKGGMPLAHEMTGEEFGRMVAELAKSSPGAVADHVRARTPSSESARPRPSAANDRPGAGRP